MAQRNDFQVEMTDDGEFGNPGRRTLDYKLADKLCPLDISSVLGLCAANVDNSSQPREREWYLKNIINPMIKRGELGDGVKTKFDDRKLRYGGSTVLDLTSQGMGASLFVRFGITHYKAFLADIKRSDEENLKLQERGSEELGDRWAFFARAPGVAVLPITEDGSIFIGERTNSEYGGFLNAVAGHLKYRDPINRINVQKDAYRELKEEFGIDREEVERFGFNFVGLYSHPIKGDLDFTFLAKVNKPDRYFTSGEWMKKVSEREHKPLVRLANLAEIGELLDTGKVPGSDRTLQVMYSTRGALQSITPYHIRN
ncbi:MAG: NUDIX hydrolase [Nanoarchaeota archaeon]